MDSIIRVCEWRGLWNCNSPDRFAQKAYANSSNEQNQRLIIKFNWNYKGNLVLEGDNWILLRISNYIIIICMKGTAVGKIAPATAIAALVNSLLKEACGITKKTSHWTIKSF